MFSHTGTQSPTLISSAKSWSLFFTLSPFHTCPFIFIITTCTTPLRHSFTPGSASIFSTNPSHRRPLVSSEMLVWTAFAFILRTDWLIRIAVCQPLIKLLLTYLLTWMWLLLVFGISSIFIFFSLTMCSRQSWFPVSFWAHVNTANGIVSYPGLICLLSHITTMHRNAYSCIAIACAMKTSTTTTTRGSRVSSTQGTVSSWWHTWHTRDGTVPRSQHSASPYTLSTAVRSHRHCWPAPVNRTVYCCRSSKLSFSALTLLVGHQACKKQDVGLSLVMIRLQLCISYSSSCHHHHLHHP